MKGVTLRMNKIGQEGKGNSRLREQHEQKPGDGSGQAWFRKWRSPVGWEELCIDSEGCAEGPAAPGV